MRQAREGDKRSSLLPLALVAVVAVLILIWLVREPLARVLGQAEPATAPRGALVPMVLFDAGTNSEPTFDAGELDESPTLDADDGLDAGEPGEPDEASDGDDAGDEASSTAPAKAAKKKKRAR